jgi:hypothetical protein
MAAGEDAALRRGCTGAFLDTFSFNARPLYERLGYRVFAELKSHPRESQPLFHGQASGRLMGNAGCFFISAALISREKAKHVNPYHWVTKTDTSGERREG